MAESLELKTVRLNLIIEQGVSDDGSINADVEFITEDTKKDGSLALTNLSDCPSSLSGQEGKTLVVNDEETGFKFAELRPTKFTSLSDVPGTYRGNANKAVVVDDSETGLKFVNFAQAELKYFTELADTFDISKYPGMIVAVNEDGDALTAIEGSSMLENITTIEPGTYTFATVTVDSKGRVVGIHNGNAASTNNLQEGGVVYAVKIQGVEGLNLASTGKVEVGQTIFRPANSTYPIAGYLKELYSTSEKKPRVVCTDDNIMSSDGTPQLNIHATGDQIQIKAIQSGESKQYIHFPQLTYVEGGINTSSVYTENDTLLLGAKKTLRVDATKLETGVYNPTDDLDLVTLGSVRNVLKELFGGNVLISSNPTYVIAGVLEYNKQFKIGPADDGEETPAVTVPAGKNIMNLSMISAASFPASCSLWIGVQDSSPVSHSSVTAFYGSYDLPTADNKTTVPVLKSRADDTEIYGMIRNPDVPERNGIYRGEYANLQQLQEAYPTDTEGNYAEVGDAKMPYVYSDANGWISTYVSGTATIWISFEF